jgi:superfamily II DNA/RNA helicase
MIALARRRDDKTEVKQPVSAQDMEEVKEESLTRLRQTHGSGAKVVQGGDFANFPDVHPKTFERLAARGITSLFPIQQHCFYPIYERPLGSLCLSWSTSARTSSLDSARSKL